MLNEHKLKKLDMVYLAAFSNNNSLIIELCPLNSAINTFICAKEKLQRKMLESCTKAGTIIGQRCDSFILGKRL